MLKIKDNVDLKELEKFGLELQGNEYQKVDGDELLGIDIDTKGIYLEYRNSSFIGNIIEDCTLDTLYDMIKADLVEKGI